MNSTFLRSTREGNLSNALAGLLDRLQRIAPGRVLGTPEEALFGDADLFIGSLTEHVRYSEETLVPAVLAVAPGAPCGIEELKEDHQLLDRYARELVLHLRGGNKEQAHGIARSLLAVLLDHTRREANNVNDCLLSLDVGDARRLATELMTIGLSGAFDAHPDSPRHM